MPVTSGWCMQEAEGGCSTLSVASMELLTGHKLPSSLRHAQCSSNAREACQQELAVRATAYPNASQPPYLKNALTPARLKADVHTSPPVDALQRQLQQQCVQSAVSASSRLGAVRFSAIHSTLWHDVITHCGPLSPCCTALVHPVHCTK